VPEDIDRAITQALASCRAGCGRIVLLSGPPGRGISHRLAWAGQFARERGMHVAAATGRAAERSLAFSIAVELLEPVWRAACPPELRVELAAGEARAAVGLLERPDPSSALADGGYAVTRGLWLLARRLAAQPLSSDGSPRERLPDGSPGLVLIVDDLHDVDAPTLGLLAYAASRLDRSPVTILAGRRVDVEPRSPAALAAIARAARILVPEPLDARGGASVVHSHLPAASTRFTRTCVAASGGNAALLHAFVSGLAGLGLSGSEQDAGRAAALVPDRVAALAAERLARLPEAAATLVRAVAALERPVALERLAASTGLSVEAALDALDASVHADVLLAEPRPAFVAPIMYLAVRASLTAGQRARYTRLAGGPAVGRERRETLTTGESRVATLAAHGMTTRQIAETLFVTPKTVEFHLRNVYAKLEIPSTRAALAQALDVREPVASAG
jgi:DNA-binding NarL/FixJ family response regulator